MYLALEQAKQAYQTGEAPVGAVIAEDNRILAQCHNEREARKDPLAHAELLALREAARMKGDWRLTQCDLYVTLEPCAMCAGALLAARIRRIVFGAYDPKQGCCGSVYLLPMDPELGGACEVSGGVLEKECAALMEAFFKERRRKARC
jgi:tRNA(adenine34) deaminase